MQYYGAMSASLTAPRAPVPPEVRGWNWGAFLLSWIWGIGNNTYVALLALVPVVNLVVIFVLGAKGSEWAWRNKKWEGVEHFRRVQRKWAFAGAIVWLVLIGLFVALYFMVSAVFKGSDVYVQALAKLHGNAEAMELLGQPVSTGFPMGAVSMSGPSGEAKLAIPVEGTKARGTIFVEATKEGGRWRYDRLELQIEGLDRRIDLETGRAVTPGSGRAVQVRATGSVLGGPHDVAA
ncbi:MAG: cytochrome c oxidase assembly factor Coa1 family protein [Usitatibacter sp.]